MKKWIFIGVSFLFILVIGFGVVTVYQVVENGKNVDVNLINVGMEQGALATITHTEKYYGTESLVILYGLNEFNQEMIVWLSEDGDFIKSDLLNKGVSREEIVEKVESEFDVEHQIHVIPGRENGIFLWEALYRTSTGEYQYVYYDFYKGTFLQSLKLKTPTWK